MRRLVKVLHRPEYGEWVLTWEDYRPARVTLINIMGRIVGHAHGDPEAFQYDETTRDADYVAALQKREFMPCPHA